jgi:hypothetical protein
MKIQDWRPTPEQIEGMRIADEERKAMAWRVHERHEEKKRLPKKKK